MNMVNSTDTNECFLVYFSKEKALMIICIGKLYKYTSEKKKKDTDGLSDKEPVQTGNKYKSTWVRGKGPLSLAEAPVSPWTGL